MFENLLHAAVRARVVVGRLDIAYPSGRIERYGDGSGPPVALRFTDAAALRAVVLDPGLAIAEMYMEGRLVLDAGEVYDLIALLKSTPRPDRATFGARLNHLRRSITDAPFLRAIGLKSARRNVARHYDLDERLYRLFLDEDLLYSCAYFQTPGMTLDEAQLAKKRLVAAKLLVRPGARVLDIGCGWGGLGLYLARVCGAEVTGVTLSQEQLRVATARAEAAGLAGRIDFRLQDYREIDGRFDNIVSVGMFEHVGRRQYRTFFSTAARLLAPDGVMLLHSIAQPRRAPYNQPFIEKYIFPGGYIPALSEVMPAAEHSGLLVRDTEILAMHYALTTRAWRERFRARRGRVLELYDERFFRMWEFYLAGSEAAFRFDRLHVFHLQLAHDQRRVPVTRGYVAEEMARLMDAERGFPDYGRLHPRPPRMLRSGTS